MVIPKNIEINQNVFYNYVFDVVKPTFICSYGSFSYASSFAADPRFRQNYIAINESMTLVDDVPVFSGDYIRKDSIINYDELMNIQAKFIKK